MVRLRPMLKPPWPTWAAPGGAEATEAFLYQFFEEGSYNNDLVLDSYLLPGVAEHEKLSNLHLFNLD